jgi:hypothetical protein
MKTPTFTYEGGRAILRDGVHFVTIHRPVDPKTQAGPDPVDVDAFARAVPAAFEACRVIMESHVKGTDAWPAIVAAGRALDLLDWRKS